MVALVMLVQPQFHGTFRIALRQFLRFRPDAGIMVQYDGPARFAVDHPPPRVIIKINAVFPQITGSPHMVMAEGIVQEIPVILGIFQPAGMHERLSVHYEKNPDCTGKLVHHPSCLLVFPAGLSGSCIMRNKQVLLLWPAQAKHLLTGIMTAVNSRKTKYTLLETFNYFTHCRHAFPSRVPAGMKWPHRK
jgi:hypothetical protein